MRSAETFPDGPHPICVTWPLPDDLATPIERWQDGRCGMCGSKGNLVLDHDHQTDLVRGYLCRSCNMEESSDRHPAWVSYRTSECPTKLLGQVRLYGQTPPWPTVERSDEERQAVANAVANLVA